MTVGAAYWDSQAATFDEQPDHGLRDPHVRAAWEQLLLPRLPPVPAMIADLGCGTGSLSVLPAAAGHTVAGLDLALWGGPISDERFCSSALAEDGRVADRHPGAQCWPSLLRMLLPASSVRATCE